MEERFTLLKEHHRRIREDMPAGLRLRVHRALSGMWTVEETEDPD